MKKLMLILFVFALGVSSCSINDEVVYPDEPSQQMTTDDDENDTNGPKTGEEGV